MIEMIQSLFHHQEWADTTLLRAAQAHVEAENDSQLRSTLHHIVTVQRAFLSRFLAAIRHAEGVASAGFTGRGGAPFHRHTWRGAVLCHQPGRIGSCTSHRDALDSWLAPFARRGAHSGRNAQSESSRPMPFALANTWPYSADP